MIVVKEQSRESNHFEALLKLGGVRSLLSIEHHAKTVLYSIFNVFQYQYQYQYGLILILNIDNTQILMREAAAPKPISIRQNGEVHMSLLLQKIRVRK